MMTFFNHVVMIVWGRSPTSQPVYYKGSGFTKSAPQCFAAPCEVHDLEGAVRLFVVKYVWGCISLRVASKTFSFVWLFSYALWVLGITRIGC